MVEDGLTGVAIVLLGFVLFLFLTYGMARVEISDEGVTVRLGPWGWPRLFRSLDDIKRAEVVRVNPLRYGGWGYRLTFTTTAIVVRGGEGLMLCT